MDFSFRFAKIFFFFGGFFKNNTYIFEQTSSQ